MVLNWVFIVIAMILLIVGVGYTLRFLSYMLRGVGMSLGVLVALVLIGGLGLGAGLWLLLFNLTQLGYIS